MDSLWNLLFIGGGGGELGICRSLGTLASLKKIDGPLSGMAAKDGGTGVDTG